MCIQSVLTISGHLWLSCIGNNGSPKSLQCRVAPDGWWFLVCWQRLHVQTGFAYQAAHTHTDTHKQAQTRTHKSCETDVSQSAMQRHTGTEGPGPATWQAHTRQPSQH